MRGWEGGAGPLCIPLALATKRGPVRWRVRPSAGSTTDASLGMNVHLPSVLRHAAPTTGLEATSQPRRPQPPRAGGAQERASPGARSPPAFPAGRCFPLGAARPAACPGSPASLTSSLCVDGHFFRRRPQLSRFPVCRCRVRARASSAPAARLSVPMAAADGGGPGGDGAAGEEGGRPAGRGARGRRAEREAGRPTRRDLGLRSGPREAGRWRKGRTRWPRRLLLLLRRPPES